MSAKSLRILIAVAVVASLLAYLGQRRGGGDSSEFVGARLLPELGQRLDDLTRITVAGPGQSVALVRQESGWTVAEQDGYPAEFGTVREALLALSEATIVEEKTANPDFYYRLGLADADATEGAGTAVRLEAGDATIAALVLGATSGSSGRFARLDGEPVSFLIDRNPDMAVDPTQWLAPELVDIRNDRVQRVEIAHSDGETLVIEKESRDVAAFAVRDIPAGRELQYASVANVTGNALAGLRLQGARRADGGVPAEVTTTFRTFDGLAVTVRGFELDGERLIGVEAAYEPEQAALFPAADAAGSADDSAAEPPAAAEAAAINARLAGWQFVIAAHIYDQMTRRMEDLLRAPPDDEE